MGTSTIATAVVNNAKRLGVLAASIVISAAHALPGWSENLRADLAPALLPVQAMATQPDVNPTESGEPAAEPESKPTKADDGTASEPTDPDATATNPETPDFAHGTLKEKWRRLTDAVRGLVTWNLFDDRVTLRAYARIQVDGTVANGNGKLEGTIGTLSNSLRVRRLVLFADGTIDHHLHYVFGYDFGADHAVWNAYIEGIDSGLNVFGYHIGQFRAGSFQEPFGLERCTSSAFDGFLERSLPTQTFTPGNNVGYMVYGNPIKERMSLAVGFFSFGNNNDENASNSTLSITARLTGLPMWQDDGRRMFHLGLSFSARSPKGGTTQYRSRPEARFVDYFADTGEVDSSTIDLLGLEAAMVSGPLWLQSEIIVSRVVSTDFGNLDFWGSYLQVGYFLTGEVRPYDRRDGTFGKVVPGKEFSGGLPLKRSNGGAFEVVGRVSNIDLDASNLYGGKMLDVSLGLNWYMNRTSKVMFNYVHSNFKDTGKARIFLLRYQYRPLPR